MYKGMGIHGACVQRLCATKKAYSKGGLSQLKLRTPPYSLPPVPLRNTFLGEETIQRHRSRPGD